MTTPRIIAFYLPQYHPTPDNDIWWGKGFTEWTNVGKAKSLFWGHYQPKVPADLGYYDLRLPSIRETQAQLAKEAGIYGFCYYHYWFGNGKMELELPFQEVLSSGNPDFPFMLCWANESWNKKFWNKDIRGDYKQLLIEQTYPGDEDITKHFYHVLPAFKDNRYIKIDGKPAFMIYKYADYPDIKHFISKWRELAIKENLPGITFVASIWSEFTQTEYDEIKSLGFDKINHLGLWTAFRPSNNWLFRTERLISQVINLPRMRNFKRISRKMFSSIDQDKDVFPTIMPNWDHTPRSGRRGTLLYNSTPENFGKQVDKVLEITEKKDENIIFLKSWNEWGEGNYMEPDLKYGKEYITILRARLDNYKKK